MDIHADGRPGVPQDEGDRDRVVAATRRARLVVDRMAAFVRHESAARPDWSTLGPDVVGHGAYATALLAEAVTTPSGDSADERVLTSLDEALVSAWGREHGGSYDRLPGLALDDGYGRTLAEHRPQVRGPLWWRIGFYVMVLVRERHEPSGRQTLAAHAIPAEWVDDGPGDDAPRRVLSRYRRIRGLLAGVTPPAP